MTQQIQLREPNTLQTSESDFKVLTQQAQMLVKTGFLPKAIDTPEKAIAIILTGKELGIPTMCALRSIDVIQGKPTVSPQLMIALINRSRELENIVFEPNIKNNLVESVSVTMKRKGRSQHTETFTRADAQNLGLLQKDNWKKQPSVMLKWRAVAACARVVFPDVVLGLYLTEEMGDTSLNFDEMGASDIPEVKTSQEFRQTQFEVYHEERTGSLPPEPKPQIEETLVNKQIADLLSELNKSGDSIQWTKPKLAEYASDLFGYDPPLPNAFQLSDEEKQTLLEDLQERLNERLAVQDENVIEGEVS
jgi:hypothetical protein